jgi:transposase-like protein
LNEIRLQVNKRKGARVNVKITLSEESSFEEILAEIPEHIDSMAIECATMLAGEVIESEVTELCGARYARDGSRKATRYGSQRGSVTIAGRKVGIEKPRVRAVGDGGEIDLLSYRHLRRKGAMGEAVLERMVRGVSCRNYEGVVTASREGFGMKKSSVSRDFIKASAARLKELVERRLDGTRFVAIFIDGVVYAGATMIVALGVSIKGEKTILGLRQGATENAEVCAGLLQGIAARGVDPALPTLFVLDGSKALKAAVTRVWGDNAVIQRCRQHKKENVRAHLVKCSWEELDWRLAQAFHEDNYSEALRKLKATASWLEKINPDAAASLNEGMEELLTVTRLKLPLILTKSLVTTNPIESVFSTVRQLTGRVSTWKNGDMRLRWCATALLQAEPRLNKLRGQKYLPRLAETLDALVHGPALDRIKDVA